MPGRTILKESVAGGSYMDRQELVNRAKAILAEAYEEAAELVMLYVERTGEPLQVLCKEIDPDNWNALRNRVQRAQGARKAAQEADPARATSSEPDWLKIDRRATKRILRDADDEQVKEIVGALPPEAVERVMHAATSELGRRQRPVRKSTPVGKAVDQRFHDATWALWLIQDELRDLAVEDEDRVRMLSGVRAGRVFLNAIERRLERSEIDDDLVALLEEVKPEARA